MPHEQPKTINKIFGVSLKEILCKVNLVIPKNKAVSEVSLVFVSAPEIQRLNKTYRGKNKATNVLSFEVSPTGDRSGDIVICPEVVRAEAKESGFTQKYWMTHLVVHGILHLAGYDHERSGDVLEMEKAEREVLVLLGF